MAKEALEKGGWWFLRLSRHLAGTKRSLGKNNLKSLFTEA